MKNSDYARLHRRLLARARRLTRGGTEAEDLAQEALLRLWQRNRRGAAVTNPEAYAMTALRHLAMRHARAQARTCALAGPEPTVAPDAPRRMACAEARAALARLPARQAELMAMIAAGETSPADLARQTGVPLGTVMSRLARARARLRRDLGLAPTAPSAALIAQAD